MDLRWKRKNKNSKEKDVKEIKTGKKPSLNDNSNLDITSKEKYQKMERDGFLKKVGKSKGSSRKNGNHNSTTVVKPQTVVRGDITGYEDVIIEGKVEGRVIIKGDLLVIERGLVEADVDARNVLVAGKINGNVYASQKIEIEKSGILNGDIKCPKVIVTEGAVLRGNIDMNYEGLDMAKEKHPKQLGSDDIIKLGPMGSNKPITLEDSTL